MKYRFYTCYVFTNVRFGGNPLAVLPDAEGLSSQKCNKSLGSLTIPRELVLLGSVGVTRNVRIFTPTQEIPFAGHPNVGTAFTLATIGEFGHFDDALNIVFGERAGPVPITIRKTSSDIWCELKAPESLSMRSTISVDLIASALSLAFEDIVTNTHQSQVASVGLPFIMVELKNRMALGNARSYMPAIEEIHSKGIMPDILNYVL
jgi:trans-2,3-dihydro-3-hydroxyanthranilate isomerase